MVGALRSNRCQTCRNRKVKCDEAWPVCGQCERGNRPCPPRPSLKIVDEGARFKPQTRRKPDADDLKDKPRPYDLRLTRVQKTCPTELYSVGVPVPLTRSERLRLAFINVLNIENPAFSLLTLGEFTRDIPRLVGHGNAVDSVVTSLLKSHECLMRRGDPSNRIDPGLYARALCNMQRDLNDPEEWRSSSTLCSALLLHRMEAAFGALPNNGVRIHASGIAALLHKRNPPDVNSDIDVQISMDCHLSIIQHAVSERKHCFLASQKWADAFDTRTFASDLKTIYYRLMRLMTLWPSFVCDYSELYCGKQGFDSSGLYTKVRSVLENLEGLNEEFAKIVSNKGLLSIMPSNTPNGLVPVMFEVHDTMAAMFVCHQAIFAIVAQRILQSLLPVGSVEAFECEEKILIECRRVWMLIEYSRCNKPLGMPAMQAALIFTVESAADGKAKKSIVDAMNDLDSFRVLSSGPWEGEQLEYISRSLRGQCPVE